MAKSTVMGAIIVGTVVAVSVLLDIGGAPDAAPPFDGGDLPEGAVISFSVSSIIAKLFGGSP